MMLTQRIATITHDLATQCHVTPVRVETVDATLIERELERRKKSTMESTTMKLGMSQMINTENIEWRVNGATR